MVERTERTAEIENETPYLVNSSLYIPPMPVTNVSGTTSGCLEKLFFIIITCLPESELFKGTV